MAAAALPEIPQRAARWGAWLHRMAPEATPSECSSQRMLPTSLIDANQGKQTQHCRVLVAYIMQWLAWLCPITKLCHPTNMCCTEAGPTAYAQTGGCCHYSDSRAVHHRTVLMHISASAFRHSCCFHHHHRPLALLQAPHDNEGCRPPQSTVQPPVPRMAWQLKASNQRGMPQAWRHCSCWRLK